MKPYVFRLLQTAAHFVNVLPESGNLSGSTLENTCTGLDLHNQSAETLEEDKINKSIDSHSTNIDNNDDDILEMLKRLPTVVHELSKLTK